MKRLWVIDKDTLSLWRRDHRLHAWPLASLGPQWALEVKPLDGDSLLIRSGALHGTLLDVPPMSGRDQTRFVSQQVAQHTHGSCGAAVAVDGVTLLQRVNGAPGLEALLAWFRRYDTRVRRVRHTAQLAEVMLRCLKPQPACALVGWQDETATHLCSVRAGAVVWHRELMPGADVAHAWQETVAHTRERGLFDREAPVFRVWLGAERDQPVEVDHRFDEATLLLALRRPADTVGLLSRPSRLLDVLTAAHGDLSPPEIGKKWQRHCAVRGVACGLMLVGLGVSVGLWHSQHSRAQTVPGVPAATHVSDATTAFMEQNDTLELRQWLAAQHQRVHGKPVTEIRCAVLDLAASLTDHTALSLERLAWREGGTAALAVVLKGAPSDGREQLVSGFAETMQLRGWQHNAAETEHSDWQHAAVSSVEFVHLGPRCARR